MRLHRKFAALVAGAALALVGPAAMADTVYNTLDNTVDSNLEVMNLTYNSALFTGSTGTTSLQIQVDGKPDHPGCNIQGNHYITLSPLYSTAGVASVSLSNGGTFNACTDTLTATVQALGVGSTDVSFVISDSDVANDPSLGFNLAQASFTVNVAEATFPKVTGCDVDPAAPAWAAAIMQKSGMKSGSAAWKDTITKVAQGMGAGASYAGYAKNAHPQYENAVDAFVQANNPTKTIVSAQAAARPGWECVTQ